MTDEKLNQYRRYSREAEEQAERAIRDEDRASWLRIAQSWLRLIPRRGRADIERFDAQADDKGTHQDVSKSQQ
jgi:hypothetical protein